MDKIDESKLHLTDDEVLEGDKDALNKRVDEIVEARIRMREEVPAERQKNIEDAKKAFAVFQDDDETIRESAELLLAKAVKGLPADAGPEQFKAQAEAVSKRLAKLKVQKEAEKKDAAPPSPAPSEGGSAAAAHMQEVAPRTVAEAEAMAEKISQDFSFK